MDKSTYVTNLRRGGRATRVGRNRTPVRLLRPPRMTAMWLLLMALLLMMIVSLPAHADTLELLEVHRDGVSSVDGLAGCESVAMSPDGAHLYAGGGVDNALAVFRRDVSTGALTFVEVKKDGTGGVDGLGGCAV